MLIQRLQELQGRRSQMDFARHLGIAQSSLSRIYSGDRSMGLRTAQQIARTYPQLRDELAIFLFKVTV